MQLQNVRFPDYPWGNRSTLVNFMAWSLSTFVDFPVTHVRCVKEHVRCSFSSFVSFFSSVFKKEFLLYWTDFMDLDQGRVSDWVSFQHTVVHLHGMMKRPIVQQLELREQWNGTKDVFGAKHQSTDPTQLWQNCAFVANPFSKQRIMASFQQITCLWLLPSVQVRLCFIWATVFGRFALHNPWYMYLSETKMGDLECGF